VAAYQPRSTVDANKVAELTELLLAGCAMSRRGLLVDACEAGAGRGPDLGDIVLGCAEARAVRGASPDELWV
jgi:hypothetical protein